jgi:capsid protein
MPLIDVDDDIGLFVELQVLCKKDTCEERFDREWKQYVIDWQDAKKDLDQTLERERDCRQRLIVASQSRNCKGFGVRVEKIIRKGSVVFSEIPDLIGVDLEAYRKPPTESWRITKENDYG